MEAKAKEKSAVEDALQQITEIDTVDESGKPLTCLNLNNTSVFRSLSDQKKKEKYAEICDTLRKTPRITSIELTNADVGNDFCEEVAKLLADNCAIEELNLNSNPVGDYGIQVLCKALRENTTLRVLKLHNLSSTIDKVSQKCMLELLKHNQTITKLVYVFPQRHDNDNKEKMLDRNVALARKKRNAAAAQQKEKAGGDDTKNEESTVSSVTPHAQETQETLHEPKEPSTSEDAPLGEEGDVVSAEILHVKKPKILAKRRASRAPSFSSAE
jgi:hypothetical protein